MDEDLDLSILTNEALKAQIAALSVDSALAQGKLDVMRAELVNRLRAGGSGRGDRGGPDNTSGVREPRRPTRPSGTGAMRLPCTDGDR